MWTSKFLQPGLSTTLLPTCYIYINKLRMLFKYLEFCNSIIIFLDTLVYRSFQIRVVFLYWLPCILRMNRPGQTRSGSSGASDYSVPVPPPSKHAQHLQDVVELKERSSKSLLANVLDIDDDFRHGNHRAGCGMATGPYFRTMYR